MAMIAVITGDVINSKSTAPQLWLQRLRDTLNELGSEPRSWQIYRGDSFQLEIAAPQDALEKAMLIKAGMKILRDIDVRLAIGIGEKSYAADKVTESNGEAFVNSGTLFEQLRKEKITITVKTPWQEFDEEMNISLGLACAIMDRWLPNYAEVMRYTLMNRDLTQKKLGEVMKIAQNTVSDRQSRAYKDELLNFEKLFRKKLMQYIVQ
jgi:hypothetical protein